MIAAIYFARNASVRAHHDAALRLFLVLRKVLCRTDDAAFFKDAARPLVERAVLERMITARTADA